MFIIVNITYLLITLFDASLFYHMNTILPAYLGWAHSIFLCSYRHEHLGTFKCILFIALAFIMTVAAGTYNSHSSILSSTSTLSLVIRHLQPPFFEHLSNLLQHSVSANILTHQTFSKPYQNIPITAQAMNNTPSSADYCKRRFVIRELAYELPHHINFYRDDNNQRQRNMADLPPPYEHYISLAREDPIPEPYLYKIRCAFLPEPLADPYVALFIRET